MRVVLGPFHPDLEDALVDEILEHRKANLFSPLLILVPSDPLLHRLKILLARERQLNLLNLHIMTFHQLSRRLLEEDRGASDLRLRDDAFAEEALRQMIQTDFQWESVFSGIDAKEGGCAALWQTLRDLKDAKVDYRTAMDALAEGYLKSVGETKLRDLFRLHGEFSSRARKWGIQDYADLDALATEQVPTSEYLQQFTGIVYYGFYDLTQIQLDLFQTVARHYPTTLLFPLMPGHPAWAFAQRFYDRHVQALVTGSPEVRVTTGNSQNSFGVIHPQLFTDGDNETHEFNGSCTIVSCSGQRDEVLTVAKEILRLVTHERLAFDEIGVVVRSLDSYLPWFKEIFPGHGIPMAAYAKGSLLAFPLVKAVLLLSGLLSRDYLRSHVIDLISSPFFDLRPYCAEKVAPRCDLWDPMTRRLGITKGFEEWRRLERHLDRGMALPRQGDENDEPSITSVSSEQIKILWTIVTELHRDMDVLPEEATWSDYATRWKALLKKYLGLERSESQSPAATQEEQIGDVVLNTLDDLSGLDSLAHRVSLLHFLRTFQRWLERASVPLTDWNLPGVAVLDAMSARGIPFRTLFVLGLNEGIFPRTIREDAFLRDATRRSLETVLGYKISEKLAAYDEEKLILALLVGAARESLFCFYRRSDEGGRALAPSWYLGEIRRAVWGPGAVIASFDGQKDPAQEKSIPRGIQEKEKVSPFHEAQWLMPHELAVRLALQGRDPIPVLKLASQPLEIYRRGLKSMKLLEDPRRSLDQLDGMIGPVPDYWQHLLERGISPTALERYARCPYQYFAVNLLELHELQRPEDISSVGPSVIGQLSHTILKSLYTLLLDENYFAGDLSRETWSTRLDEVARKAFSDYATENPVGYPVAWEVLGEELSHILHQVVERDLEELAVSGFRPMTLEPEWRGRLEETWPEPLGHLPIVGSPDRIDYEPEQSHYRVIDYKLRMGKNESAEDHNLLQSALRGKRLQLPLYVLLAQQHAPVQEKEAMSPRIHGAFYLIAPRWVNGPLAIEKFPEEGWEGPYKERLQATLRFLLKGIQGGRFFILPDDHCKNCEVRAACRRNHRPSLWRAGNDPAVRSHGELNKQKAPALQGRRGS